MYRNNRSMRIPSSVNTKTYADVTRDNLRLFENLSEAHKADVRFKTTFHDSQSVPPIAFVRNEEPGKETVISVEQGDTLAVARSYLKEDPCVLNMASVHKPGGGWLRGATAQEEMLCYRSELYLSLAFHAHLYPLSGTSAIYSKDIVVFRDDGLEMLRPKDYYKVSFVSIPALCIPKLIHGCLYPDDVHATKEKIRTLLRIAALHGHMTLILGAFGCGAYGNPPNQMATMFKDALGEQEFKTLFHRVVFAIVDGARTDNYRIFRDILSKDK